jgi:hypothetical protein
MSHPEHHMYVDTNKRTASLSQSEFFLCFGARSSSSGGGIGIIKYVFKNWQER